MTTHIIRGSFGTILDQMQSTTIAYTLQDKLIYVSDTEFGVLNPDGSKTFFHGSGIGYDWNTGFFTGGTITHAVRYMGDQLLDDISGLNLLLNYPGDWLGSFLTSEGFSGNDVVDARGYSSTPTIAAVLVGFYGDDKIYGSAGNDKIYGDDQTLGFSDTTGNDVVYAGAGNDFVLGGKGADKLYGNSGNDRVLAGAGIDLASGGSGNDFVSGGAANDDVYGGSGNDYLQGGSGHDYLNGGTGTDTAVFEFSRNASYLEKVGTDWRVHGPVDADYLTGVERLAFDDGLYKLNSTGTAWVKYSSTPGAAIFTPEGVINGTESADTILPNYDQHFVTVFGRGGDDTISLASGNTLAFGGDGNDTISLETSTASQESLRIYSGNGNDTVFVRFFADGIINGGAGDDVITAFGRGDLAGSSPSVVVGGSGNDTITANGCRIYGGSGNDTIYSGDGIRTGGAGADVFHVNLQRISYNQGPAPFAVLPQMEITDFEVGVDRLQLNFVNFSGTEPALTLSLGASGYVLDGTYNGKDVVYSVLFSGLSTPGLTLDDLTLA